jgi:hypothetical protein
VAVKAYVLIEANIGKTREVVETIIISRSGISVDVVTGPL